MKHFIMPYSVSRMALLIVHSYLVTVAGALPVTETTTSRETDVKQTEAPLSEANTSKMEPEDSLLISTGQLEPFRTPSLPKKVHKNDENDNDDDDDDDNRGDSATLIDDETQFQPCKVVNVTYQHREQIPRSDPCEMCVCVDSEMYCFWKLCGFHKTTTTATTLPSTSSLALETFQSKKKNSSDDDGEGVSDFLLLKKLKEENEESNEVVATNEKYSKIITDQRKYNILKKLETTTGAVGFVANETANTKSPTTVTTSTTEPVICYVMGVIYKYGEVLPKDTGTCLECACSEGGRVTCSPKDCVSQPDLDYLSHNNNMDLFDIDTF